MLALLLVAGSLGLSNFGASIAIGLSGVDGALRLKVALAFGLFEAGMPLLGLVLGRQLAHTLSSNAHILAGALLAATGLYTLRSAARTSNPAKPSVPDQRLGRLLISGAALSIDNLLVGFALGTYHVSIVLAAIIIAAVSVALSLAGLELGQRLGQRIEHDSEILSATILIAVGAAIATGLL